MADLLVGELHGVQIRVSEQLLHNYLHSIREFERLRSPALDRGRRRAHNALATAMKANLGHDQGAEDQQIFDECRTLASRIARKLLAEETHVARLSREAANLQHYASILSREVLPLTEAEFVANSLTRRAAHQYLEQIVESVDQVIDLLLIRSGRGEGTSYRDRAYLARTQKLLPEQLLDLQLDLVPVRNRSVHDNAEINLFPHIGNAVRLAKGVVREIEEVR